jgi:hypothetical protein
MFPTLSTQQAAVSTIPTHQAQLQSKGTAHRRHGHLSIAPQRRQEIYQEVTGNFLYYEQCVNSTMLAALGSIATQQANQPENMMKKV